MGYNTKVQFRGAAVTENQVSEIYKINQSINNAGDGSFIADLPEVTPPEA